MLTDGVHRIRMSAESSELPRGCVSYIYVHFGFSKSGFILLESDEQTISFDNDDDDDNDDDIYVDNDDDSGGGGSGSGGGDDDDNDGDIIAHSFCNPKCHKNLQTPFHSPLNKGHADRTKPKSQHSLYTLQCKQYQIRYIKKNI